MTAGKGARGMLESIDRVSSSSVSESILAKKGATGKFSHDVVAYARTVLGRMQRWDQNAKEQLRVEKQMEEES